MVAHNASPPGTPPAAPPVSPAPARGNCVVCLETGAACMAAVPCGHQALCEKCAATMRKEWGGGKCPICRARVESVVKVYVAEPSSDPPPSASASSSAFPSTRQPGTPIKGVVDAHKRGKDPPDTQSLQARRDRLFLRINTGMLRSTDRREAQICSEIPLDVTHQRTTLHL
jgi:hypothetical protein